VKLFVRDQFDYNLLDRLQLKNKSRSRNRLSAAYVDYLALDASRMRGRVGRQNAAWGGESRYDGASGSYSFRPKWKASAVIGSPVDGVADSNRYFVGTSVDADAITPNFGASAFVMQRMIDGQVDRRNVGTDLRWFAGNGNVIGSVDVDTIYRRLNRAALLGMYMTEGNAVFNFTSERQAMIPVSLSQTLFFRYDALQKQGIAAPRTIKDLLGYYSMSQLRQYVRNNTSYINRTSASISFPVTPQWQLGSDVQLNSVGAVAPNEANEYTAQLASGITRSVGLSVIGTNLYSGRDTHAFSVNAFRGRYGYGQQLNYSNMSALSEAWQIEPNFHWVRNNAIGQTGAIQSTTVAWGPGFRASFKPQSNVTLESSLSLDRTSTRSYDSDTSVTGSVTRTTTNSKNNLFTYYLGYKYEF